MNPKIQEIESKKLVLLRRNPQYVTPAIMERLKKSIRENGFLVNLLVRPYSKNRFEIISGNHRFLAGQEIGMKKYPCIVINCPEQQAKVLAMNLNMIHGDPPAELIAPFLADIDLDFLKDVYIPDDLYDDIVRFDDVLKAKLERLEIPDTIDHASPSGENKICICPICKRKHLKNEN